MKAKVFKYKFDGNTVVAPYMELEPYAENVYLSLSTKNEYGNESEDIFHVVCKIENVFFSCGQHSRRFLDKEERKETTAAYCKNWITNTLQDLERGVHISLLSIRVFEALGLDTAPLWQAREAYLKRQEQKRLELKAKEEEEQRLKEKEWQRQIDDCKQSFLNGERIEANVFLEIAKRDGFEIHAIIITGMSPGDLAREEMQVYTLIVGRMLEAFSPSCKVEYTTVDAVCVAHKFRTRTYRILEKGWTGVLGREHLIAEEGFSSLSLPELSRDELVEVAGCSIIRKRNLPPSPYTDAELVGFMDRNGLGTVATRANIIRTLLERKYIRYSGKYVIPTPKGLFFYETVRGMKIADASLTSGWEAELAQIERGERTPEEFLDGVLELVKGITGEIRRIQRPEE